MQSNSNSVGVIIPTLNRVHTLKETLDSYALGEIKPDEILVVDQTTDLELRSQLKTMLSQYNDMLNIRYFFQEEPSSTKARNLGIRMCESDIVIFSDDDVIVKRTTISSVRRIMQDNQISMIAGLDLNRKTNKSILGYVFLKKEWRKRNCGYVTNSILGRFPETALVNMTPTEWAMGFFFVVRKELLNKWKITWDENLTSYAYAEDLDFSFSYYTKSKEENYKCIMDSAITVDHKESREWRIPRRKNVFMYVINREYLSYKHHFPLSSRIAMRWCNVGDIIQSIIRKQNPMDYIIAQHKCNIHNREIRKGILKPEWYK